MIHDSAPTTGRVCHPMDMLRQCTTLNNGREELFAFLYLGRQKWRSDEQMIRGRCRGK